MESNGSISSTDELQARGYHDARTGSVIYLAIVVVIGIIANSLVIIVFWKYRKLRTATNLFIFNLAVCDITLSLLDSTLSLPSSLSSRWLFGSAGCMAYGFLHYFFICNTVVTLAVISIDRFFFITKPNRVHAIQPNARLMLGIVYLYTLLFAFPPIVGWNSFVEERYFHSGCYINYVDQQPSSIAYSVIASVSLFLVPLAVMIYCYTRIFLAVRKSTQRTTWRTGPAAGGHNGSSAVKKKFPIFKRTHIHTAKMIIVNIFFFMIVWFPYVVVSLIKASSGEEIIAPLVSHVSILVAKSCVIYNVLIYVILNRKLKAAFIDLVCCGKPVASLLHKGQSNNVRMRISRILSETEVPTNVADTQRNRLSALNDTNDSTINGQLGIPRSSPRIRNGVVKTVEFEDEFPPKLDGYRRAGGSSGSAQRGFQEENSLRKKKAVSAKTLRVGNGSVSTAAATAATCDEIPRKAAARTESTSQADAGRRRSAINVDAASVLLSAEPNRASLHHCRAERPHRESTSSTEGLFTSPDMHEVSPSRRNSANVLHMCRRPSRAGSYRGRNIPGDSGCPTSTDQESDFSSVRTRSREGSFVRRTASTAVHRLGARPARSRTAVRGRRRRRSGNDPLHTSPRELLEIQNYWKRMSLCLDDIDLDDVTKEIAIV